MDMSTYFVLFWMNTVQFSFLRTSNFLLLLKYMRVNYSILWGFMQLNVLSDSCEFTSYMELSSENIKLKRNQFHVNGFFYLGICIHISILKQKTKTN